MKTSYFAKYKKLNGVSIAIGTPTWFKGKSYKKLMPSIKLDSQGNSLGYKENCWDFLNAYKRGIILKEKYIEIYNSEVLNKLNAQEVYNELIELAGEDSVLLCWEKSSDFCHRHIVAEWFKKELGIIVEEYIK